MAHATAPIGVFDSGVGGLTVLAALRDRLPNDDFLYLGDTARLPYGTKSSATIVRYSLQAAALLVARGVRALVIACNTASSVALPALRERYGVMPVIGVVEPGAAAAVAASRTGRIAVIATEGTVRGGAYQRAILARRPDAQVSALACPLFVALAEEGWQDNEVARAAARCYLQPLLAQAQPDTLVLGCTHFPLLRSAIAAVSGPGVAIVDSARTTADAVLQRIGHASARAAKPAATVRFLVTDGAERFSLVGARFLGTAVSEDAVEVVDL